MATAVYFRSAVSLAGRFPLLAGVDLSVEEGELVHLRGPNGAGKSSLLRACAGLVPIVSGEAFVLGYDLRADRREVRREIGLLGHSSFLYEELSVDDNLRFALRAARVGTGRLDDAIDKLGLGGRLRHTAVGKLSAGQRRRTAIAVLYARAPRLWLLDEPHAGLDDQGRDILDGLLRSAGALGATVIIASHELERATSLADRIVTIAGGQIRRPAPGREGERPEGPEQVDPSSPAPGPAEEEPRGGGDSVVATVPRARGGERPEVGAYAG